VRGVLAGLSLAAMLAAGGAVAQPSPFLTAPGGGQGHQTAALPDGEGRDLVMGVCSGCHSIALVAQQRLSRSRWDALIDWMEEEQGMAELDSETRAEVLDYLATHLSPNGRG
jgi:mono/diheme cytochrome c family protein